jgi:uncharacterized membrane protein (UPF0127 family)
MSKYRIFNSSKRTELGCEVEIARTPWARMRGLLGRKASEFAPGKGLWLVPAQSVHTIGMTFPIDVVFLDSQRRVVHIRRQLSPFRITTPRFSAKSVIELPPGTVSATDTSVGDVLDITDAAVEGRRA